VGEDRQGRSAARRRQVEVLVVGCVRHVTIPGRFVRLGARLIILLVGAMLIVPAARAAEGMEPPLELMYAKPNTLVAGRLLKINPSGRLVFSFGDLLSGQSPPAGYIFAFSLYKQDPTRPGQWRANSSGAEILVSLGIEPALFEDTRQLRAILKASQNKAESGERRLWQDLLKALKGKNPALQNLAANQIAMDPELRELAGKRDQKAFQHLVLDQGALPSARTALLVGAQKNPEELGDWWQEAARYVLETTPVGGYASGTGDPGALVLSAFSMLEAAGQELPTKLVSRWVESTIPLASERALLALRRSDPSSERAAIRNALANQQLPEQTRKFLNDHLRRLDLLETRLRAQKEGSH
jgi:hypothetical protein